MQLHFIDIAIIAAFFAVSLVIGFMYTKKAGRSLDHFFLSGRNLPWWLAGTSMVATTFAADTPLAVTEMVANGGVSGNWLWWNGLIGGMLAAFLFAGLWRRAGIVTDVEFIELRYEGKPAAFLRGFKSLYLGILMNSVIIAWVNVALASLLQVFFGIPENQLLWYVAAAMFLVMLYSSLSGLMGVVVTDFIQFIIAMTGTILLAFVVVNSEAIGGLDNLKAQLPEDVLRFIPAIGGGAGTAFTISFASFFAFVGMQWWASWYPGSEPGGGGYVAQRMMSAKNEEHAIKATLFFQIAHYALRPWPWILVALCSLVLYPDLAPEDKKLGYVMAMKDFLPTGLKGLLLAAFFAAYMSTISTQLNWGASYAINDCYKRFMAPNASEKQLVRASRVATGVLMLIGLFITTQITTIQGAFQFIIECGAGLGAVLILRWFWWRINAWSEIAATAAPFVGFSLTKFVFARFDPSWSAGVSENPKGFFFTVGFTTLAWIATTYLTPPTRQSKLIEFYKRIRPEGCWTPIAEASGLPARKSKLPTLLACWIAAIVLGYSCLFVIGKVLFGDWTQAAGLLLLIAISGYAVNRLAKEAGLFGGEG